MLVVTLVLKMATMFIHFSCMEKKESKDRKVGLQYMSTQKKEEKRRFSLEGNFMKNSKVNDYLYGTLQSMSQLDVKSNIRYVDNKDYIAKKSEIANHSVNKSGKAISVRTVQNHLNTLISCGFVVKDGERLILPYDEKDLYKLIPVDMLNYILDAHNSDVLKVYLYLLNKSYKPNYQFTKKELMENIGYSTKNNMRDYERINNILHAMRGEDKLITFEERHDSKGLPFMVLKHISHNSPVK